MPLLKIEHRCEECNYSFILAVKPENQQHLSCCPFCASPINYCPESDEDE